MFRTSAFFIGQELASNAELQCLTVTQKAFVSWPTVPGAKKKGSVTVLKLNLDLLMPLVGHSLKHKKIGHVDYLRMALESLNYLWEAQFLIHHEFVKLQNI